MIARRVLLGLGDAALGEWLERGSALMGGARALHLRRRLSEAEISAAPTEEDMYRALVDRGLISSAGVHDERKK